MLEDEPDVSHYYWVKLKDYPIWTAVLECGCKYYPCSPNRREAYFTRDMLADEIYNIPFPHGKHL